MIKKLMLVFTYGCFFVCPFHSFSQVNCTNWLSLPSQPSYAEIGDLDIPGTQVTIEAMINRTSSYTGGSLYAGDVVSKHRDPADVNYLLRPNSAEITTTNGYFRTPDICEIELNKTYHIAMVYDGSTLKFYRNGFLMSQVAATGNLFQNNWKTRIGYYEPQLFTTNFIGYINEVRIWNVARTQTEIRSYMNASLPTPASQTGLLAYYTFNNLLNKQGNAAWNATLNPAASLNGSNPTCATFTADSCSIRPAVNTGGVINDYTEVLAYNTCNNSLLVANAGAYKVGDTVLLIQMKGAYIDSSNTTGFGTITDYRDAGNYEFNYISQKNGNNLSLKNKLTRSYTIPDGIVQLVRVPYYQSVTISSPLTCMPWDGSKGGVLVLNVANDIILNAAIDVSNKGFRGGPGVATNQPDLDCFHNEYYLPKTSLFGAQKGESIVSLSDERISGKGAPAAGGGGGNSHNSGGGGGGNGGAGGFGGYQFEPCGNAPFDNRGIGGRDLGYSNAINKIFPGSGGGAGHQNNVYNPPLPAGAGGGIAIITGNRLQSNANKISSNGENAIVCIKAGSVDCHDASGGGGAGGTILINVTTISDNTIVETKGGKGADLSGSTPTNGKIGPGGGGGGGVLWLNSAAMPGTISHINTGGERGVLTDESNIPWGTTPGTGGTALFNLNMPIAAVPFKKNFDSVRISVTASGCNSFDFNGLTYTNSTPAVSWNWTFGDGTTAITENTSHNYTATGSYTVKLLATDINGCKDSFDVQVSITNLSFDFTYMQDICNPLSLQFTGEGNTLVNPFWSFGDGNTVTGNLSPVHTFPAFGDYTIKFAVQNNTCVDTITKIISVDVLKEDIIITPDTTICNETTKQLRTRPALNFCWSPTTYLDDPSLPNPTTSTPQDITYYFNAQIAGNNLISNGDFSAGNTGFTSEYNFANPNVTEGQYFIGPNPQAWNPNLSNCQDHTGGSGNMLLVNGAPVADVNVWKQTITVTPNTNYAFATWIQALWPPNPAQLQFSINAQTVGSLITAALPTCTWSLFYTTWNSGNNTSATIAIVNKNTLVQGNDFALDDISFAPVLLKRDSVIITVDKPVIHTNNDTTVCSNNPVLLSVSGANTYSWLPATGLSTSTGNNLIATPDVTTEYIVTGTTTNGCVAKDTVLISTFTKPTIAITGSTLICPGNQIPLFVSGGASYVWSPTATLNNPAIANPVAIPDTTTKYIVQITDINNCTYPDSVTISVRPYPTFTVSPSQSICQLSGTRLSANGGDNYAWAPSISLDDPASATPVASPQITTTYEVVVSESVCNFDTTMQVTVTVNPNPIVTVQKSNDVDCSSPTSILTATGASTYTWSPANWLDDPTKYNPVAGIDTTTTFYVTGFNEFGCASEDSVTVIVTRANMPVNALPNAFTPNGDGKNDCFGIRKWGAVTLLEFSIYNRWGQLVFTTNNPTFCWDGTFKGKPQDSGGYAYVIRAKTFCGDIKRTGILLLIR